LVVRVLKQDTRISGSESTTGYGGLST